VTETDEQVARDDVTVTPVMAITDFGGHKLGKLVVTTR
jgi:hypothetical protein